jgi:transcriptional regulator of arginine metabolism
MSQPTSSNSDKAALLTATQELLQKGAVKTQEGIKAELLKQGFKVNQTKISRLLHKIGAIKLNEGKQTVYRLPTELAVIEPKIPLSQLVLGIDNNETLIVIHTSPGSAELVARLLDLHKTLDILGTVAGDDTIFVAPKKIQNIQALTKIISKALFG